MERNSLSEEEALKRIRGQMTNSERIEFAHVIVSNQWEFESTQKQVAAAWAGINNRKIFDFYSNLPTEGVAPEWIAACSQLGVAKPLTAIWWRKMWNLCTGKYKFYHNMEQLRRMFSELKRLELPCQRKDLLTMAMFFHDVIYDTTRSDNEEQSAMLFKQFSDEAGCISSADTETVVTWIRRTQKHLGSPASCDEVAALLDLDLSILGSEPYVYERYAENIRREYSNVPFVEFVSRRCKILSDMNSHERLFYTEKCYEAFETRGRENLKREIARLRRLEELFT
mmetsp:Transcript_21745/g.34069  ORF Transcript_21745/g.34069 Transcript_21745/m.34069 type:complete len:283 (+) Transcript_21745:2-850(+)